MASFLRSFCVAFYRWRKNLPAFLTRKAVLYSTWPDLGLDSRQHSTLRTTSSPCSTTSAIRATSVLCAAKGSYCARGALSTDSALGTIGCLKSRRPTLSAKIRYLRFQYQFQKILEFLMARSRAIYDFPAIQVGDHSMCAKMSIAEFTANAATFIQRPIDSTPIGDLRA